MSAISFNPMDPEFVADPYPTYHRLRAEDPVHHSPLGFWMLTRYEDVVAVLRDARFAKEAIATLVAARFGVPVPAGVGLSMLDRDPPDHTRLRGLVSKAFTPRVVERLRPHIQQIVDGLLARVEGAGSMDLIEEFAYPLPVTVICEMLGVPVEDHERFKAWGVDIARGLDAILLPPDSELAQKSLAGRRALAEYFRGLIAERRTSPLGGRTIGKAELVMPFIGAADRDPAQFPDPDRLDITRADNRHIAFGWGIHFCLGAPLARVEGQIAINTLVQRLPKLALATASPEYRQSLTLRGLQGLPVSF